MLINIHKTAQKGSRIIQTCRHDYPTVSKNDNRNYKITHSGFQRHRRTVNKALLYKIYSTTHSYSSVNSR